MELIKGGTITRIHTTTEWHPTFFANCGAVPEENCYLSMEVDFSDNCHENCYTGVEGEEPEKHTKCAVRITDDKVIILTSLVYDVKPSLSSNNRMYGYPSLTQ